MVQPTRGMANGSGVVQFSFSLYLNLLFFKKHFPKKYFTETHRSYKNLLALRRIVLRLLLIKKIIVIDSPVKYKL